MKTLLLTNILSLLFISSSFAEKTKYNVGDRVLVELNAITIKEAAIVEITRNGLFEVEFEESSTQSVYGLHKFWEPSKVSKLETVPSIEISNSLNPFTKKIKYNVGDRVLVKLDAITIKEAAIVEITKNGLFEVEFEESSTQSVYGLHKFWKSSEITQFQ